MKKWETRSGYQIIRILDGRSNAFVIKRDNRCIMVDSGRKMKAGQLLRRLKNLNIDHIDHLILTHSHFDHAENVYKLKEEYNPMVLIHESEAQYLRCGNSPLPQGTILVTRLLLKMFGRFYQSRVKYPGADSDINIGPCLDLESWGYKAYILHTPGHSRGSISVIVDDDFALVGDAMVGEFKTTVFQPFADDVKATIMSWKKLLDTGCQLFLPAHGDVISRNLVIKDYERYRKKLALD